MDSGHLGRAFHGGAHYENFPVASWLLPSRMRPAMLALYRFARTGDDLADEGELPTAVRLKGLEALRAGLLGLTSDAHGDQALTGLHATGRQLGETLLARGIPTAQAERLLEAFRKDAAHVPMASEAEVLDYCSYSANPVGRLVLAFSRLVADPDQHGDATHYSDAICSGLQLVNFAQDLGQDFSRRRIYIPSAWWPQGWTPEMGAVGLNRDQQRDLAMQMAKWGKDSLQSGRPLLGLIKSLPSEAPRRLTLEIALVIGGGTWIADRVLRQPLSVWHQSPQISRLDLPVILLRALRSFLYPSERR